MDDVITESVQYYTIKTQFQMTTLTSLDDLKYQDSCECRDISLEGNKAALQLIFIIDGSDSFNNKRTKGAGMFELATNWVNNFIRTSNFSKRGDMASIITVIQFSGISQYTKEYIPGVGNGKIDDNFNLIPAEATRLGKANDDLDHWRFEVTPFDAREKFVAMRPDPLDGNGQLFLCLQDLTIPNGQFQVLMDTKLKQASSGESPKSVERVLIVLSDDEWDVGDLSCYDSETGTFQSASSSTIIDATNDFFNNVYVVTIGANGKCSKDVENMRRSTASDTNPDLYRVEINGNLEANLHRVAEQIKIELQIDNF